MKSTHKFDALMEIALDLTASLSSETRYQRLIAALRQVVPCDAAALLRYEEGKLVPVAAEGLSPEFMGRQFAPAEHPRLMTILDSRTPVLFPADDERPDPYDGLVDFDETRKLHVHSCMGKSLYVGDTLVGVLTVDALKLGAFDDVDESTFTVFAALAAATMRTAHLIEALEQLAQHRGEVTEELVGEALRRGGGLIGDSKPMRRLKSEIDTVAQSDLTVLITGETGVGKEIVARTVHSLSTRNNQPLVHVNCAALPESIAESELFGHVKGAFTGASRNRAGKFELANGGTLFLDEVGELPLAIQATLLRVLQSGEIQRVGADQNSSVDVRIIAATNRDLGLEVREGRFRADLYHRLSVYPLIVPPLRECTGDIALLAGHFLDVARVKIARSVIRISPAAMEMIQNFHWPGNIREMEHVIMRGALRASAQQKNGVVIIDSHHLDIGDLAQPASSVSEEEMQAVSLTEATEIFQRNLIKRVVAQCGGNWSQTAGVLDMDRSNLHRLARRLGLK